MKVITHWWGVILSSENDNEKILLHDLLDSLPAEAQNAYSEGKIENKVTSEGMSIIFNR